MRPEDLGIGGFTPEPRHTPRSTGLHNQKAYYDLAKRTAVPISEVHRVISSAGREASSALRLSARSDDGGDHEGSSRASREAPDLAEEVGRR